MPTLRPVKDHGIQFDAPADGYVRAKGLHMSDIYNALAREEEPDKYTDGPPDPLKLGLGLSFEERIERLLAPAGWKRPGEFIENGIIFTPDLTCFNEAQMRMGEIKLTWMSNTGLDMKNVSTSYDPKFRKWFRQMALYGYALECAHHRLIAYFVNGDYKRGAGMNPQFGVWDVEFSPRELKDEWADHMGFAKSRGMLK